MAARKKASRKKASRKKTAKQRKRAGDQLVKRLDKELKQLAKDIDRRLKPLQKEFQKAERRAGTEGARLLRQARKRVNAIDLGGHSDLMVFMRKQRRGISHALSELETGVRPHRKKAAGKKKAARKAAGGRKKKAAKKARG